MCLTIIAINSSSNLPLLVAHNRDEFKNRPYTNIEWQSGGKSLYGKDLQSGGTWLAVSRNGFFAIVTNIRGYQHPPNADSSRGVLVKEIIEDCPSPRELQSYVLQKEGVFKNFNILYGSSDEIFVFNSVSSSLEKIGNGIFGLSNDRLDTPWPKLLRCKKNITQVLKEQENLSLNLMSKHIIQTMEDSTEADDSELPKTGLSIEQERLVSPIFIDNDVYGTVSTTIIAKSKDHKWLVVEKDQVKNVLKEISFESN